MNNLILGRDLYIVGAGVRHPAALNGEGPMRPAMRDQTIPFEPI